MTARIQAVQLPDAIAVTGASRGGERITGERGVELAARLIRWARRRNGPHHAVHYFRLGWRLCHARPMIAPLQSRGRTPISGGIQGFSQRSQSWPAGGQTTVRCRNRSTARSRCHRSCAQPVAHGEPDPLRRVRRGDPRARRRAIPRAPVRQLPGRHDREQASSAAATAAACKDSQLR